MKVEPQTGSIGMYWVESATNPDQRHVVDFIENQCGCAAWVCRQRAHRAKWGEDYKCRHIIAVEQYNLSELRETMKQHILSQ